MPTASHIIVREIGKRVGAFRSASAGAGANTDYLTLPLTTTVVEAPTWTLGMLFDLVADAHSDLAMAIASAIDSQGIGNHPWRVHFADVTANVANAANLPTVGSGGNTIIGALGRPYDTANTDQLMTMASAERVSAFTNNTAIFTNDPHLYHVNGTKVYHTTANVNFPVCVYERSAIATIVAANGNFGTGAGSGTVPDPLVPALVAGGIAMASIEEELLAMAAPFATYYAAVLERIAAGRIDMPGLGRAA